MTKVEDTVTSFFNELQKSIDESINQRFSTKLTDYIVAEISKHENSNVSREDIQVGVHKLKGLLKQRFDRNMDKFELYSKRNIFSDNILGKRTLATALLQISEDDQKILDQAREKFIKSQTDLILAKQQLQESESLLKEMRDIMFSMRVQHQRFEESPLDHSLISLQLQRRSLQELLARSDVALERLGGRVKSSMNPPVTEVVAVEQEESAKTMSRMSHEQATNLFAPPTALPRPVSSTTNNVRRLTTSVRTPAK